jgi:hypothetical protein
MLLDGDPNQLTPCSYPGLVEQFLDDGLHGGVNLWNGSRKKKTGPSPVDPVLSPLEKPPKARPPA